MFTAPQCIWLSFIFYMQLVFPNCYFLFKLYCFCTEGFDKVMEAISGLIPKLRYYSVCFTHRMPTCTVIILVLETIVKTLIKILL